MAFVHINSSPYGISDSCCLHLHLPPLSFFSSRMCFVTLYFKTSGHKQSHCKIHLSSFCCPSTTPPQDGPLRVNRPILRCSHELFSVFLRKITWSSAPPTAGRVSGCVNLLHSSLSVSLREPEDRRCSACLREGESIGLVESRWCCWSSLDEANWVA